MSAFQKHKRLFLCLIGFLVPVVVLGAAMALCGITPFGKGALLATDVRGQYCSFFSYYRQLWLGGKSWFYTFSKALGGDMVGFSAYYLLSPLNVVFLLFDEAHVMTAFSVLVLLKTGLCGSFATCFFAAMDEDRPRAVGFGAAYALCAYMMVYAQSLMWLDGVLLLPLILLGIERLLNGKRPFLYLCTLAPAIFCNYYIGYMLCIASVLWFLLRLFTRLAQGKVAQLWQKLASFAAASLLAGGLCAVLLLPLVKSLEGSAKQAAPLADILHFATNFSLPAFFAHWAWPTFTFWDNATDLPNVFVGTLLLLCAVAFFAAPKIRLGEKLLSGGVLLVLIASVYLNTPNLAWHGFLRPNWFPYRQAFVLCFFTVWLAFRFVQSVPTGANARVVPLALAALLAVNTVQLGAYAVQVLRVNSVQEDTFAPFVQARLPLESAMAQRAADEGLLFYRNTETQEQVYNLNDALTFGTAGLSHYSSGTPISVTSFLRKMGYSDTESFSYYGRRANSLAADSFLGTRYLLTATTPPSAWQATELTVNEATLYENPLALPLGMTVTEQALTAGLESDDADVLLNALYSAVLGQDAQALVRHTGTVTRTVVGFTVEGDGTDTVTYTPQEGDTHTITYDFTAEHTGALYVFFPGRSFAQGTVTVNGGEPVEYFRDDNFRTLYLGEFAQGDTVSVVCAPLETLALNVPVFVYEQTDVLQAAAQKATAEFTLDTFRDDAITCTVQAAQDGGVLFTIPYDAGWRVTVDGAAVQPQNAAGALLYVPVAAGTHALTLRFVPRSLRAGALLSALCLLAVIGWLMWPALLKRMAQGKRK